MPGRSRARRLWRHPAVAAGLVVLGLLLFLWPFVREPRPGLGRAWLELMLAWTAAVAALWAVSRRQGPGGGDG